MYAQTCSRGLVLAVLHKACMRMRHAPSGKSFHSAGTEQWCMICKNQDCRYALQRRALTCNTQVETQVATSWPRPAKAITV